VDAGDGETLLRDILYPRHEMEVGHREPLGKHGGPVVNRYTLTDETPDVVRHAHRHDLRAKELVLRGRVAVESAAIFGGTLCHAQPDNSAPSTISAVPLTYEANGEANNTQAFATSAGSAKRPNGILER
jgi:hypothetical protein